MGPELRAWLAAALPGKAIVEARALTGGFRNDNTRLRTDTGEQFVLRRYSHGNTCAIEAALAARLAGVVPVAEVIAADPDGATAGQPVLLSRFMPGVLLETVLPATGEARQLGHAVGATLAAIGTISFPRPGFFTGAGLSPDGVEPIDDLPGFVQQRLPDVFTAGERQALLRHAERAAASLTALPGSRQLVHSDFNPKNLLVDGQTVTAVLDWEFALSSSPLIDVGNLLRFEDEIPPIFAAGFTAGFAEAGGTLPDNWRAASLALDLYALADFLTRPPDHPFFGKAVTLIRRQLAAGWAPPSAT